MKKQQQRHRRCLLSSSIFLISLSLSILIFLRARGGAGADSSSSATRFRRPPVNVQPYSSHDDDPDRHSFLLQLPPHSSCLSRVYEPRLRLPDQNIVIPPPLEAAWAKYRHLHAACAAQLTRSASPQRLRCQYLILSDALDVGLGNRLLSLASALAFAIATNRAILIDNRHNLADLLCEPFLDEHGSGQTWRISAEEREILQDMDMAESIGELWKRYGIAEMAGRAGEQNESSGYHDAAMAAAFRRAIARRRNPDMVKVRLWDETSDEDLTIFTDGAYTAMAEVTTVVWESDLYTIPNLLLVHQFWKKMTAIAAVGEGAEDQVFAVLTRLALMPSNAVWATVMREFVDYVAGTRALVGLQVRLHGGFDPATFTESAYQAMLACLVNASVLPPWLQDREGGKGNAADSGTAIQEYGRRIEHGEIAPDLVVVVASLQSQYFLRLKQDFSDADRRRRLSSGDGYSANATTTTRVHTVSSLQMQDFSRSQAELAMAEMWILSLAQKLATSASSTFGYAAHSWANRRPLILDFPAWRTLPTTDPAPRCRVAYSTDPCSHLPRRWQWTEEPPHIRWLRRHVRKCQDRREGGWQIVRGGVGEEEAPAVL